MKAVMLAAGIGKRLTGGGDSHPPKSLLEFGGQSLLSRHREILAEIGVTDLTIVVGYRADDIQRAAENSGTNVRTEFILNDDYLDGTIVSMWCARNILRSSSQILLMDADVLYPGELLRRLIASPVDNCFTFDAGVEDDDFEAVKICMRGGNLVEFRKQISGNFDSIGEWPGFLKLSPEIANALADRLDDYVASGKSDQPYEEAVRDILLEYPENTFGIADVTGIPWIEIDFPEDAIRAEQEILPAIKAFR